MGFEPVKILSILAEEELLITADMQVTTSKTSFKPAGTTKTINRADILGIVLPFYTSDATAFKGNVFVDNIRSKTGTTETVISDFNKTGSAYSEYESGTNDNLQLSLVARPANTAVMGSRFANNGSVLKNISVSGKKLIIRQNSKAVSQARVLDIMGKVLVSSDVYGSNHTIDCGKLASGNYLVEIIQGNSSEVRKIILQ